MRLQVGSLVLTNEKAAGLELVTHFPTSGWWPWLREGFAGAWQRGIGTPLEDGLTHPVFWACVTLMAGDIGKLRPRLVEEDANGIETEVDTSPFLPVIRKPNHYQHRIQFYIHWVISKLTRGNTYVLKARDARGVVTDLYILDPTRVRPMVTPSGDIYYALGQDLLSGITEPSLVVPARDIIHDRGFAPYHPLVGLSLIAACGQSALLGLKVVRNTSRFADNGAMIGGLLVAPGQISKETADRLEKFWNDNYAGAENAGKIAALGDGLKFEKPAVMSAVDAQIIEQLRWTDEKICSVFHIPAFMVGVGPLPAYNNVEALAQQYYSQCLQEPIESIELCLTEGILGTDGPSNREIEFDVEHGLLRMDSVQRMEVASKGVAAGILSPNDGRARHNLKPAKGGDEPRMQQQYVPLSDALAPKPAPVVPGLVPEPKPPVVPPVKSLDDGFLEEVLRAYETVEVA